MKVVSLVGGTARGGASTGREHRRVRFAVDGPPEVVQHPHAQGGLVVGVIGVSEEPGRPCAVWCQGPPIYVWVAIALGLQPTVISVDDDYWRGYVQSQWPTLTVLPRSADRFKLLEPVLLADEEMIPERSRAGTKFWRDRHLELVVVGSSGNSGSASDGSVLDSDSAKGSRLPPSDAARRWEWHRADLTVNHSAVGGVTDGVWRMIAYSRSAVGTPAQPPHLPPQPLAIFVDQKLSGRPFGDMPAPPPVPNGLHLVRAAKGRTLYSSHGWLRSGDLSQYYVVPSIFHRACVRRLGDEELIRAWDVPATVLQGLPPRLYKRFVRGLPRTTPCKVASEALRAILRWNFDRGGCGSLIPSCPAVLDSSPAVLDNVVLDDAGENDGGIGQHEEEGRQEAEDCTAQEGRFHRNENNGGGDEGASKRANVDQEAPNDRPAMVYDKEVDRPAMVYDKEVGAHYSESLFTCTAEQYQQRIAALNANTPKEDDAEVPVIIWDDRFRRSWEGIHTGSPGVPPDGGIGWRRALWMVRRFLIRVYRRRLTREFRRWLFGNGGHGSEREAAGGVVCGPYEYVWAPGGRRWYRSWHSGLQADPNYLVGSDAVRRAVGSSWFGWDQGSTPLFWRWPEEFRARIRDGQPHMTTGPLPALRKPQVAPDRMEQVKKKMTKLRRRNYIEVGEAKGVIPFFAVDKGETDVRMVFNGSAANHQGVSVNSRLWAPHFSLPTVTTTLRAVDDGTYFADMDIAEMFYNFFLHEDLRRFCGVDITLLRSGEDWEAGRPRSWERWCRAMMGLTDSPYRAVQIILWAKEIILGDRHDETNPFRWHHVELNLLGSPRYDARRPMVSKRRKDGSLSSDVFAYMDDKRPVGSGEEECWRAARRAASQCNFLGIQDAARKRKAPSQTPGPWAGTITRTANGVVGSVPQSKWAKLRVIVREDLAALRRCREQMDREPLESNRGFLNHIQRTYWWVAPYLKGYHLTLDGWRPYRSSDGWKLTGAELRAIMEDGDGATWEDLDAPPLVAAVPRFEFDLEALVELTEPEVAPVVPLRAARSAVAKYLTGDASGQGFGSALWIDGQIEYESGLGGIDWAQESSNWREATNLAERIGRLGHEGRLRGSLLVVLTDNSTFESTFWKGSSKTSPKLHQIILELYKAARDGGFMLRVYHISGRRMIAAGVDGLSRGDRLEGMMAGRHPLSFIPFDEDANGRSKGLVSTWVDSWWPANWNLIPLDPTGWFEAAHGDLNCLWMPPPAAMEAVLEQFAEAKHKRPHVAHVFVVPCLMTGEWRKRLMRDMDVYFTVAAFTPFWASHQFEPLFVGISLPLIRRSSWRGPWQVRGSVMASDLVEGLESCYGSRSRALEAGRSYDLGGQLCESELLEAAEERGRSLLCEFCLQARRLSTMPDGMVRELLRPSPERSIPDEEDGNGGGRRGSRDRAGGSASVPSRQ